MKPKKPTKKIPLWQERANADARRVYVLRVGDRYVTNYQATFCILALGARGEALRFDPTGASECIEQVRRIGHYSIEAEAVS